MLMEGKVRISSLRNGMTDDCEAPCGCWELNPGPLEEQPVFLTQAILLLYCSQDPHVSASCTLGCAPLSLLMWALGIQFRLHASTFLTEPSLKPSIWILQIPNQITRLTDSPKVRRVALRAAPIICSSLVMVSLSFLGADKQ
jgi:hypothetical protein